MAFGISAGTWLVAGTALAGAGLAANAANNAAHSQVNAANNATQLQQNIYNQNQANLSPYMQMGTGAGKTLASMLQPGGQLTQSFTPADYLANRDPGYQFQLQQGQQALQNSQAAGNGVLSGTALKDLMAFNQNYASTGYQNAFDRWQSQNTNVYNRLAGLAGLGENAAAGAGNTGATIGANMAGSIMGAGNAQAAGQVGVANALTGGLNNASGYYMLNQMTKTPGMGMGQYDPNSTTDSQYLAMGGGPS